MAPGDFVQPGGWGRAIAGTGTRHNLYFREHAFERVRRESFSERPSRLASAFAFESLGHAEGFQHGQLPNSIYEVEAVDAEVFRADVEWIDRVLPACHSFETVEWCISEYWSGRMSEAPKVEILSASGYRVVRRVTAWADDGVHRSESGEFS